MLVDSGYSIRAFEERAQALDFDPASLDAILVTHEHDDHLGGVLPLSRKYGTPVYWTRGTQLACAERHGAAARACEFSPHAAFRIGDLQVLPVPVPHDAREPASFPVVFIRRLCSAVCCTGLRIGFKAVSCASLFLPVHIEARFCSRPLSRFHIRTTVKSYSSCC